MIQKRKNTFASSSDWFVRQLNDQSSPSTQFSRQFGFFVTSSPTWLVWIFSRGLTARTCWVSTRAETFSKKSKLWKKISFFTHTFHYLWKPVLRQQLETSRASFFLVVGKVVKKFTRANYNSTWFVLMKNIQTFCCFFL